MTYYEVTDSDEGRRIDLFNENWYKVGEDLLPSVTFIQSSIITRGLAEYFKQHGVYADMLGSKLKDIGSLFHRMCELLLRAGNIDYLDFIDEPYFIEAWRRMPNFYSFYQKHLTEHKILDIESTVYNKEIGYAGTMDLITEIDDIKHVWDWKSSKAVIDHHKSQVAAYAKATDADFAHVVAFPEFPRTKQGYSLTTLKADGIEKHFEDFLFLKSAFDRQHKQPIIKSLPIKFEIEK